MELMEELQALASRLMDAFDSQADDDPGYSEGFASGQRDAGHQLRELLDKA